MSRKASSRKRRTAKGPPAPGSPGKVPRAPGSAGKGATGKDPTEKRSPEKPAPVKREPVKPAVAEIPPRMVGIAYVLALLCLVTPLTVLGSGFAGAVLFTRGMRREGAGVIVVSVVCVAVGFYLRTQ